MASSMGFVLYTRRLRRSCQAAPDPLCVHDGRHLQLQVVRSPCCRVPAALQMYSRSLPSLWSLTTSLRKAVCTLADWSWCFVSCDWLSGSVASWNSSMSLATSGPAIVHCRRALELSVTHTALPSPLMAALFCSWAWSMCPSTPLGISIPRPPDWALQSWQQIDASVLGYFRVWRRQFHHVSQMLRNPAPVVGVIQGMEPHCSFSEGIYLHRKWRLARRVHVHQDCQLQLQYSCSVVEMGASLRL